MLLNSATRGMSSLKRKNEEKLNKYLIFPLAGLKQFCRIWWLKIYFNFDFFYRLVFEVKGRYLQKYIQYTMYIQCIGSNVSNLENRYLG